MAFLNQIGLLFSHFSIFLLIVGLFIAIHTKQSTLRDLGIAYLSLLLFFELTGELLDLYFGQNLILFSISSFIHFVSLGIVFFYIRRIHFKWFLYFFTAGSIPLINNVFFMHSETILTFYSYDRVIYSLVNIVLCLIYFYHAFRRPQKSSTALLLFMSGGLLFFTIDCFLSLGTDYLVQESLTLVAWFWFLRALILHLFYGSIIILSWKNGKIQ